MDSDTIQDLKQFIETTVGQQLTSQLTSTKDEIRADIEKAVTTLREEIQESQNEILNAIGGTVNDHDSQLKDHELRITHLEAA